MAYTSLGNVRIAPGADGGTSAGVNTTGADLIWFLVTSYSGNTAPTVSDSKSNTWNSRTAQIATSSSARLQMFWCNPTSVGSGHTFTIAGTGSFSTGYVQYLSGAKTSLPVDQEISGTSVVGTVQAGSVTPAEDNELCVSGYIGGNGGTINESYTLLYQDNTGGSGGAGGVAYKIQTTAAATNPTWTTGNAGNDSLAYTITFKAAASTPTGAISATQAPNTSAISASRSSDLIAAQAKNVSAMAGSVTITGTAVAVQQPNLALLAGSNTTSASITTPPMKNNTGAVLSGETGVVANVYNSTTGALILHKTGLTSDGNGVVVISDPLLAAGATYAYEIVLVANGRRLPVAVAA